MLRRTVEKYSRFFLVILTVLVSVVFYEFYILWDKTSFGTNSLSYTNLPTTTTPTHQPISTNTPVFTPDPGTVIVLSPTQSGDSYVVGTITKILLNHIDTNLDLTNHDVAIFFADLFIDGDEGPFVQTTYTKDHDCQKPLKKELVYHKKALITDKELQILDANTNIRIDYLIRDGQVVKYKQQLPVGIAIGICQ